MRERAPRGLVLAACIATMIPYVNGLIALPVLWTIAVCMLQSTVNRVARLSPMEWDATASHPALSSAYPANPAYPAYPAYPANPANPANVAYPADVTYPAYPANAAYPANVAYPANAAHPGYPPAIAVFQASPEQLARQERARQLVNWSHVLGWGGLVVLLLGTIAAVALAGAAVATFVGVASAITVVVGAIIGQIGRGMQGRAI